ncbi:MAG: nicotinamide-nucleotide amidohydrolase family protein [Planctomycetes bacterium]|nr:nicotinamide-nucleotide amidohydrolase family protein [Planctomycetota bacterium]
MHGKPTAIICLSGSELTRGETKDLNGPFLGTELASMGIQVKEFRVVPDDPGELARVFKESIEQADIVLVSGGLGPTADDHTVKVVSGLLGRGIRRDPEARERMRQRALKRLGSEDKIPANYYKQAEVVEGAKVLLNPLGLAPGSLVETERGFIALLPGVPRELQAMFRELVAPEIRARYHLKPPRIFRAKILGLGESWAESRIEKLGIDFNRVEYGISAQPGELLVKFIAHRPEDFPYVDRVRELLAKEFGEDLIPLPEGLLDSRQAPLSSEHSYLIHELLLGIGRTVATAESCTGGLIAKRLSDHGGSSAYFLGSVVAYDNRIKEGILGVSAKLIAEHGAVSEPACRAMAFAAKRLFSADYGLGVTGIAGPTGGTPEKPVGLVFIGLAAPDSRGPEEVLVERHHLWGNREAVRAHAAVRAMDLLRRDLLKRKK